MCGRSAVQLAVQKRELHDDAGLGLVAIRAGRRDWLVQAAGWRKDPATVSRTVSRTAPARLQREATRHRERRKMTC